MTDQKPCFTDPVEASDEFLSDANEAKRWAADELSRVADAVAFGQAPFPSVLPAEQAKQLAEEVAHRRQARLVGRIGEPLLQRAHCLLDLWPRRHAGVDRDQIV